LYALLRSKQGGESPIVIDLKDVHGTHLLTKASTLTSFRIQDDAHQPIFVQATLVNWGTSRKVKSQDQNNDERAKAPAEGQRPGKVGSQSDVADETQHKEDPE
jgi:hypothetical protein